MSPEQAAGDRDLDGRSDVYTLGLVGYELLAGVPAFDGPTGATLLVKQLTEMPAALAVRAPGAPPALAAVIERAIEKDPGARWPDAASMRDALDEVLDGVRHAGTPAGGAAGASGARRPPAAVAGAPSAGAAAPPPARGWRRRAVPAALAVGLLALGGYAAARSRGGPPAGVDPRRSFAVAPFDVLSPDPQLRWLREGSVNMLTLNLAQWRDVRVADYERTLDALRDLDFDASPRLARDDARALARRVGAWTVVTGRVQGTATRCSSSPRSTTWRRGGSSTRRSAARRAPPTRARCSTPSRATCSTCRRAADHGRPDAHHHGVAGRVPRLPRRRARAQLVAAGRGRLAVRGGGGRGQHVRAGLVQARARARVGRRRATARSSRT
jgi:TolB-like protein